MNGGEPSRSAGRARGVTWRAIGLGAALIPFNAYWIQDSAGQGYPTTVSLFFNVVFCLFWITALNAALGRAVPKYALSQGELLTVYTMTSIASALAGHDMLRVLIPMIAHPFRFATPENEWAELFHRYIPDWIAIKDKAALEELYQGESSLYQWKNAKAWAVPALAWTAFLTALTTFMLGINLIVRRQWTENEKLSYPIIQLPLEMTAGGGSKGALRSGALWAGFALAGAVDALNGLNFLYPSAPSLGGKLVNLQPILFNEKPWNAAGWTPIGLFPFAVGMAFFIPLDLAFSSWFFYLFWKAERIVGGALGLRNIPRFPYVDEQSLGAYIGLFLIAAVVSRRHLAHIGRGLLRRGGGRAEKEPFTYRGMLWLLLISGGGLFAFCKLAGMSTWAILLFFAVYFMIAVAVTRMRAELGSPVHDLHFIGPDEMGPRIFGTRVLGPQNLTMFSYFFFFNRAHRGHPMPHQLEGYKLAERAGSGSRRLTWAMLLAAVAGILASFWAYAHLSYEEGARTWFAGHPFNRLRGWLATPIEPDAGAVVAAGAGLAQTVFLMAMRMKYVWWPFHPAGFAISSSWSINVFWFSIFVSNVLKWILLKQGGLTLHRRAAPFFLGLILGEFVVGGVWSLIGVLLNRPMYRFLY